MKFITITHANLKTKVEVVKDQVAFMYWSDNHKALMIVSSGGAIVPATESLDDVKRLLTAGDTMLPASNKE